MFPEQISNPRLLKKKCYENAIAISRMADQIGIAVTEIQMKKRRVGFHPPEPDMGNQFFIQCS
jgi:hypothetical protein